MRVRGVLQSVQTLVGDANQLVGLFAILRKSCDAVVHRDGNGEFKRTQHFRENDFHTTAEGKRLNRIGLRKK